MNKTSLFIVAALLSCLSAVSYAKAPVHNKVHSATPSPVAAAGSGTASKASAKKKPASKRSKKARKSVKVGVK